MLIQFYCNSDMDLQSFGSEVLRYLLDEGIDGVVTDQIFFNRFMLYQPEHRVLYKTIHRNGGLSISELNRVISAVFETSIVHIDIDFCTVIGDHKDGPVYKSHMVSIDYEDHDMDNHATLCSLAKDMCDCAGLLRYAVYRDDHRFMLTDGIVRTYPCDFPSISHAVREIKRFQNMVNKRDLRVTSFEVLLENDYTRFSVFREELPWLL